MKKYMGAALGSLALASGCAAEPDTADVEQRVLELRGLAPTISASGHRIHSLGAFSCDFSIDFQLVSEPLGATIERDRILFQRFAEEFTGPQSPGMIQKHIPFVSSSPTTAWAGGRYLFQGRVQAAQYEEFITERMMYPGTTQFLDRPEFSLPDCKDWTTLVAWEFSPVDDSTAFRTERFSTNRDSLWSELRLTGELLGRAPDLVSEAESAGFAQIQILQNLSEHEVQLVYYSPRLTPNDGIAPDGAAFGSLISRPPLAEMLDDLGLSTVLDRTSFTLNVWLPYEDGDQGQASVWPNSGPFPEPWCGDSVCVPSRGETADTCSADCSPQCGDTVCQPGEAVDTCPTDCAVPLVF